MPTDAKRFRVPRHRGFGSLLPSRGGPFWADRARIGAAHFCADSFGREAPGDAGSGGIALLLLGGDLGDHARIAFDAPVEALAGEHADLDLDRVEPAGLFEDEVELDPAQDSSGLVSREVLIQSTTRMPSALG